MASGAATSVPETILVAPDKFKGSFSAVKVADALARGLIASGRPVDLCPVADGGKGTLAVLMGPMGLEPATAEVCDPLGRPVRMSFGLGARGIAVVESAAASDLPLPEGERDVIAATTYGIGELIGAAIDAGARTIYVAAGGSAATDGGEGAIRALEERGGVGSARIKIIADVGLAASLPWDPRAVPATGSAVGLAEVLWARFGAELIPGASFVLDAVDYDARMRRALAVVTGEGRLDRQSLIGKLVSEVATRARQSGVPCNAVVGENDLDLFDLRILDLQLVQEARTLEQIEAAARRLGEDLTAQRAFGS